ncbi:MAG: glutathionylspermidine synthase family protein [Candidatus Omnitrophica bacterium]|nr:glutathionylspermidine synthase family protein [Candidatus Omnitrophota bacterium]
MDKFTKIHSMGRNAEDTYDRFLLAAGHEMIRTVSQFEERVHQSLFKYGRFAIPTFFKPYFLTPRQEKLIKNVTETMARILEKVIQIYFEEPQLRRLFNLSKEAAELIAIDPGYKRNVNVARFDSFLEGENLKLIELNTDSPAGMGYADLLEDIFFETHELEDFFHAFHFRRDNRRQKLLESLLGAYGEFQGGSTHHPRIAIVDWRTVRTRPEFEALKAFFEERGYPTTIADPRDLRLKHGKLYHDDFQIDLVYRRVIFNELLEKLDEVKDFIEAYRTRVVCVVNSFRSKLAGTKTVLSILTTPEYDHFFTEEENKIKSENIPWTRRVIDCEHFYGTKKIFFIDFLKDEKEQLVMKPSEGYGAKDVTVGLETRDDDWNRTIDKALKSDWVLQEFVRIPFMNVPIVINNKLEFVRKKSSINPFCFGGRYATCLSRLSEESVINVSHGGGLIPSVSEDEVHNR